MNGVHSPRSVNRWGSPNYWGSVTYEDWSLAEGHLFSGIDSTEGWTFILDRPLAQDQTLCFVTCWGQVTHWDSGSCWGLIILWGSVIRWGYQLLSGFLNVQGFSLVWQDWVSVSPPKGPHTQAWFTHQGSVYSKVLTHWESVSTRFMHSPRLSLPESLTHWRSISMEVPMF